MVGGYTSGWRGLCAQQQGKGVHVQAATATLGATAAAVVAPAATARALAGCCIKLKVSNQPGAHHARSKVVDGVWGGGVWVDLQVEPEAGDCIMAHSMGLAPLYRLHAAIEQTLRAHSTCTHFVAALALMSRRRTTWLPGVRARPIHMACEPGSQACRASGRSSSNTRPRCSMEVSSCEDASRVGSECHDWHGANARDGHGSTQRPQSLATAAPVQPASCLASLGRLRLSPLTSVSSSPQSSCGSEGGRQMRMSMSWLSALPRLGE